MKIGILGAGSWAIAIAARLLHNSKDVMLWARDEAQLAELKKTGKNSKYELDCELKGKIEFVSDLNKIKTCKYIIVAVPTQAIRDVFNKLGALPQETAIVNVSKGIEILTGKFISEISEEFYPSNSYAMLSGPSHAEEVARNIPTALVVSSKSLDLAVEIQKIFSSEVLRVYTNDDVIGVEVSSAMKNIIALAAGVSDGLGFGDNTKAAIITRGLAEIRRLGKILGANPSTFNGLAGVGDLIVTATSRHSRNMRCGILIGKGMSLDAATKEIGMVVEGASTVKAAYRMIEKYDIEMPITEALYKILYEDRSPIEAVKELMQRDLKAEYS